MDFGRLKELVKKLGGLLVLDGDRPLFVVLSYDKYQELDFGEEISVSSRSGNAFNAFSGANGVDSEEITDETTVEKLNQEILALKEEIRQKEEAELLDSGPTEEVTAGVAGVVDLD